MSALLCRGLAAVLALGAAPASALEPIVDAGETLEARLDTDFNADGRRDIAYVTADDEHRHLYVTLDGGESETLTLDTTPLGPGTISFAKGVLVFEDLTGGTTATQAIRRYRFDPAAARMRLIGFDATLYSRTFAHDGFELSWNLLTGKLVTRELHLNRKGGDAAYDPIVEKVAMRRSPRVWVADTPDPEDLIESVTKP
jgi:hypothetical protein